MKDSLKTVTLRTFLPSEWQTYREVRLRSLKDSPDAFSTTYEQMCLMPEADLEKRFVNLEMAYNHPIGAFIDSAPVGMAWVKLEGEQANLFQMWVDPKCRGLGVGSAILEHAIEWAASKSAVTVHLGVTAGDTPARRMYDAMGFQPIGELEPLRQGSELMLQNMVCTIGEDHGSS